jgi:protein phosphatase PTC7
MRGSLPEAESARGVRQGQLKSANVGDSGFVVLGRTAYSSALGVKYHSPQQEHSFGCPYQLGHYEGADAPEDAMLMTLPVRVLLPLHRGHRGTV